MACRCERHLLMVMVGHARLLAALIAAVSLHVLLILCFEQSDLAIQAQANHGLLNVVLVESGKGALPAEVIPSSTSSGVSVTKREELKQKMNHQEPFSSDTASSQQDQSAPEVTMLRSEASAASSTVMSDAVPAEIEATILAKVVYPRSARRRGWQGQTELGFNVSGQSVQRVTLLASSGHSILDQAARNGLISVRSLPLGDGSYRLPVVFRLQ